MKFQKGDKVWIVGYSGTPLQAVITGNSWWGQPVNKDVKPKEHKPPEKCDFCGKAIEDGDYYYGGYDDHKIYSETCDNIRCYQWLNPKKRGKKI